MKEYTIVELLQIDVDRARTHLQMGGVRSACCPIAQMLDRLGYTGIWVTSFKISTDEATWQPSDDAGTFMEVFDNEDKPSWTLPYSFILGIKSNSEELS